MTQTFEQRLADRYGELSSALQRAADFLVANPVDIATRPLRSVSRESGVSPATYSRLSRALSYEDFGELREEFRAKIGERWHGFAERAERLQHDHAADRVTFFEAHLSSCMANLQVFGDSIDFDQLGEAVDRLNAARKVLLLGALGSTGVVEYLSYMASFAADNWQMAGRMGASLGSGLTGLDARDALVVVTKPPFSERAIRAAEWASERDAYVLLITDSHSCPALKFASSSFVVPTESPHFYSSYVATLFFVEALIGMIVSRSGEAARARIADVEAATRALSEVWTR